MARSPGRLRRLRDSQRDSSLSRGLRLAILAAQGVIAFGVIAFALYLGVRTIASIASTPEDAAGVLDATARPESFAYEIQSARRRCFSEPEITTVACTNQVAAEMRLESDAVRSFQVDLAEGVANGILLNVLDGPTRLLSDGKTTALRGERGEWRRTDPVPVTQLVPPMADEIAQMKPVLVSDTDTVRGARAWKIRFTPNARFLEQMFLIQGLRLTGPDQQAISAGRFRVDRANAWVGYDERYLLQYEVAFTLIGGPSYRMFVQFFDFGTDVLKGVRL